MVVTSYGRKKNLDDEMKKTKRRPILAPAIAVRLLKRKKDSKETENKKKEREKMNNRKERKWKKI